MMAGGESAERNLPNSLANRLRTLALCWIAVAGVAYLVDLLRQTQAGLTDGARRPFGDDFINYWSAPYLAWHGRLGEIYNFNAFHAFEQSIVGPTLDFYHYSYPPVMLLLTAPLAIVPYVPGLFAWLIAGWLAFYAALRAAVPGRGALWLALATPAVFINAVGGQNGTWSAALLGGGLTLLERRPILAGMLLGALVYKPQLGILLPFALVAGRHLRAFLAAGVTAAVLLLASLWLFGADAWAAYFHNTTVLRHLVLEDPTDISHRMVSVFTAALFAGAGVSGSYAIQAVIGLAAAIVVVIGWYRDAPQPGKNALLVLGTCLATPYLQDYDLVFGAFIVVWLSELYPDGAMSREALIGAGLILLLPFVASLLARMTGFAFGPLFIAPVFVLVALRIFFPAARAAPA
jgi:hypothetical protein